MLKRFHEAGFADDAAGDAPAAPAGADDPAKKLGVRYKECKTILPDSGVPQTLPATTDWDLEFEKLDDDTRWELEDDISIIQELADDLKCKGTENKIIAEKVKAANGLKVLVFEEEAEAEEIPPKFFR